MCHVVVVAGRGLVKIRIYCRVRKVPGEKNSLWSSKEGEVAFFFFFFEIRLQDLIELIQISPNHAQSFGSWGGRVEEGECEQQKA